MRQGRGDPEASMGVSKSASIEEEVQGDSIGSGARGSGQVIRPNLGRSDPHMGSIPGEE